MINDVVTPAVAGVVAGLGVAMPLGAVAALLLREGLVNGFRTAAAGAAGVATVDLVYCIIAALTGATFARAVDDHRGVFLLTSGVLIVAIGVRQLWQGMRQPPRAAAEVERSSASASAAFGRFVGLTAINPITLVYFIALSGAVTHSDGLWIAPVIFVVAVGGASLAWQLLLAWVGSAFGGALSLSATRAIGVIASFLIVALGMVAVVNGAAALG
ncbi:LysE family transporter [Mycolicibacterium neoaurum]|uniref:LysE family transporter n=1 Tax=Mycolicibacterium neoaurum TaxID=1795 RepID=UPI001F4CECD5|nr:LysE family transporter [Mycolicibacterium neoaurum]